MPKKRRCPYTPDFFGGIAHAETRSPSYGPQLPSRSALRLERQRRLWVQRWHRLIAVGQSLGALREIVIVVVSIATLCFAALGLPFDLSRYTFSRDSNETKISRPTTSAHSPPILHWPPATVRRTRPEQ